MSIKPIIIIIMVGIASAERYELLIEMPKIKVILNTLIGKISNVVTQMRNPVKRLSAKEYIKNLLVILPNLQYAIDDSNYQMQILDTVVNSSVIADAIKDLKSVLDQNKNLVESLDKIVGPLLKYFEGVLRTLDMLNSDDEDERLVESKEGEIGSR
jgi:hypothetical protein